MPHSAMELRKNLTGNKGGELKSLRSRHAGREGFMEIGELLLARGANVDAKDNKGLTPLHRAAAE